nr:hypothetical protein [Tanacetum cinerariifolium]
MSACLKKTKLCAYEICGFCAECASAVLCKRIGLSTICKEARVWSKQSGGTIRSFKILCAEQLFESSQMGLVKERTYPYFGY